MRELTRLNQAFCGFTRYALNLLFLVGILLFPCLTASAQSTPKVELFTGYAYTSNSIESTVSGEDFHGVNVAVTGNFTDIYGVVGEINAGFNNKGNFQTYLFGPKFTARKGNLSLFAQLYFGGSRIDSQTYPGGPAFSATSFAVGAGVGVDYRINERFTARIIQADLIATKFDGRPQANSKLSCGIIFNFGK